MSIQMVNLIMKQRNILIFVFFWLFGVSALADEMENPQARAMLDVCIELDNSRSELFKMLLREPYSCGVNFEKKNVINKLDPVYKVEYQKFDTYVRSIQETERFCVLAVSYCIDSVPGISPKRLHDEMEAIAKKWYKSE